MALATAQGSAGIAVVRVSGCQAANIATRLTAHKLRARYAHYGDIVATDGSLIDSGITLFFPSPHSFTGEDIVEFQVHGGPVVVKRLIQQILSTGQARLAEPGEFSQRAFVNDKMDLTQAEAIADLINASSEQAAIAALNSLQGNFSRDINQLVEQLIHLRAFIEASLDFPDEEIEFLEQGQVRQKVAALENSLSSLLAACHQGTLLHQGIDIAIVGRPNAGKSSLLNFLSESQAAIVTDIEGTTRDVIKQTIHLDGLKLNLIDTAGVRATNNEIEKIGIERAKQAISNAQITLLLCELPKLRLDQINEETLWHNLFPDIAPPASNIITVITKADLSEHPILNHDLPGNSVSISTKTGWGIDMLKHSIKDCVGFQPVAEDKIIARERHVNHLVNAQRYIQKAKNHVIASRTELLAEDLRLAQIELSQITGVFTSNDLLGQIFSSFCIGK